jgi:hypothetical protein
VDGAAGVLVEGHYQTAVVAFRPHCVAVEVLLHPAVTGVDLAVVHAVAHVRAHECNRGEFAVVAREGAERLIAGPRQVSEIDPRASVSLRSVGRFGADADPQRVLVLEWVDPPWGAGHWIPDMVERAGGEPLLGHKGGHAEETMWDAVREEAPRIVVVAPCGYHLAEATEQARVVLAELATTPAGRHNEVWAIDADAYVVRPGPRLVDGLELLAWIIAGAERDPPHPHAVTRVC